MYAVSWGVGIWIWLEWQIHTCVRMQGGVLGHTMSSLMEERNNWPKDGSSDDDAKGGMSGGGGTGCGNAWND